MSGSFAVCCTFFGGSDLASLAGWGIVWSSQNHTLLIDQHDFDYKNIFGIYTKAHYTSDVFIYV
jgi:hypothetical protein